MSRVVITGIGTVTSSGIDYHDLWNDIKNCKTNFSSEKIYSDSKETIVSKVSDEIINDLIPKRSLKKIDKFTSMSLIAAEKALEDANLVISDERANEIGVIFGNSTGGWSYVEPQLYDMYTKDLTYINSYVATSWFPTAPQGEISIKHNLLGYSKTISADSLSGGYAINHALHIIRSEKLKGALVGASEAPFTPLVYNALLASGLISQDGKYNPYSEDANGHVIGEGAIALMLEDYDYAVERGASIVAEIDCVKLGPNIRHSFEKLTEEIEESIDYMFLSGMANIDSDRMEISELEEVLDNSSKNFKSIPVGTAKKCVGNLLAASIPLDIVIAALMIKNQELPSIFEEDYFTASKYFTNAVQATDTVKSIVVNGQDFHKQGVSILVKQLT